RVGIIGANPDRGWAAQAHIPALKSLSDDFEILNAIRIALADLAAFIAERRRGDGRVRPAPQSPRRRPGAHHPRLRRASGAHRIDGVGKPLALALHALPAGSLTFAGGIERSVANLDLTL